jgi:hypothetical protein
MSSTSFNVVVQAENRVNAGLDAAEKEFRAFDQRMKRMRGADGGGGGILESTLGKFAVGGAALASMEQIGAKLAQATERAIDLKKELDAGRITTAQFVDEQARAIPVIGNVVTAAGNVLELITGWKTESAAMVAQAEATNKVMDARLATQKLGLQFQDDHLDRLRKIHQQEQLLLVTGAERLALSRQFDEDNALKQIDQQAETEIGGIREKNKGAREAARSRLNLAREGGDAGTIAGAQAELDAIGEDEDRKIEEVRRRQAESREAAKRMAQHRAREDTVARRERARQDEQRLRDEESQAEEAELRAQGQPLLADDVRSRRERDQKFREIERDRQASRETATPGEFSRIDAEARRRRELEEDAHGRRQQESLGKHREDRRERFEREQADRQEKRERLSEFAYSPIDSPGGPGRRRVGNAEPLRDTVRGAESQANGRKLTGGVDQLVELVTAIFDKLKNQQFTLLPMNLGKPTGSDADDY